MAFRIATKILEEDERLCDRWKLKVALLPEVIEIRPMHFLARRASPGDFVKMAHGFHFRAPFGKGFAASESGRQIGENREVVACLTDGRNRLLHRDDETVV